MKKAITILLSLFLSTLPVAAGSGFDVLHSLYRANLENSDFKAAIRCYGAIGETINDLEDGIASPDTDATLRKEMIARLEELGKYRITQDEAEHMLFLMDHIYDEEDLLEMACFLYDYSPYYKSSISISDRNADGRKIRVYMERPGTVLDYRHEYSMQEGDDSVFVGYRSSNGGFHTGEFTTLLQPVRSEAWVAVYERGYFFTDPVSQLDTFVEANEQGTVRIPTLVGIPDGFKFGGWMDVDTKQAISSPYSSNLIYRGTSMTLTPIWERIEVKNVHFEHDEQHLSRQVKTRYYFSLYNDSNNDIRLLVSAYGITENIETEKVFGFVDIEERSRVTLGPFTVKTLATNEKNETGTIRIETRNLENGNEWSYDWNFSITR